MKKIKFNIEYDIYNKSINYFGSTSTLELIKMRKKMSLEEKVFLKRIIKEFIRNKLSVLGAKHDFKE